MQNNDYVVIANKIKIHETKSYVESIDFVKFFHETFNSDVSFAVFIIREKIQIKNVNM